MTLLLSGCAEKNNSFVSSGMQPVPSMAANECGSLPAAESARPGGRGCCPFLMNRGRQGETQICSAIYVPQETGEQMSAVFSAHGFKTIIRLEHNIPKRWLQRDM